MTNRGAVRTIRAQREDLARWDGSGLAEPPEVIGGWVRMRVTTRGGVVFAHYVHTMARRRCVVRAPEAGGRAGLLRAIEACAQMWPDRSVVP